MFKDLFKSKSKDVLSEYQARGEETGVFSLALVKVDDPFDPDPLWDRKYGGNSDIVEEMSEDNDFRLQAALDGCRDIKFVRDEAGRFREQTPVFTDVVMWVPEAKWRQDAMHGGHRIEALQTNLGQLHSKKFARSLPGDREPNYCIMPDEQLEADSVVFQFGFGVFLPNEQDQLLGSVSLRRTPDGEEVKLPDWSFWKNGAQIKRSVGVFRNQGSLLITPDRTGPVRAPLWFKKHGGHISVNLSAADSDRVYADDDNIVVKEAISPKKEGDPFQWVLHDKNSSADDTLVVEVQFIPEPATERAEYQPPPKAREKAEPAGPKVKPDPPPKGGLAARVRKSRDAGDGEQAATAMDDVPPTAAGGASGLERFFDETDRTGAVDPISGKRTPLSTRFSLKLSGCALLRIDGDQALPGLEEWVIWFDADGRPVQKADARKVDPERCLAIAAVSDSRHLYYRPAGEYDFHPVKSLPCDLHTETGAELSLLPSPEPKKYHAVLMLPAETGFPLSSEALILGRSDSNPNAQQPDLPMELLDHPQALRWTDGTRSGGMLNALNLSRRHVSLRLVDNRLEVGVAEGKTPIYVLDRDMHLLKTLEPGEKGRLQMEPDEFFMVGSYLLRFHQERHQTMMSHQATVFKR